MPVLQNKFDSEVLDETLRLRSSARVLVFDGIVGAVSEPVELSDDGLHPNAKGYEVMGPLAEQAIGAAFKKKK